jgi:hypothetical protein
VQWQEQQEEVAKQQAAEEAKAKAEAEQQEEAAKQHAAEEAKAKAEAEAKRIQKEAAKRQTAADVKRKKKEKRKREEPLDLLRSIHEEVHLQNTLEASGYRSPTWRILRALKGCSEAKVLVGESMITAAPFFEGAGRPSKPYWGPQQGRRVILWESLSPEDQQKCLTELQNDEEWVVWCKANPKDKTTQAFREYGSGEIHLSPSFWYTTAHGTFFLSFRAHGGNFLSFRAHGGNFLSFKQKRQKNATMGPARHTHA